MNEKDFLGKPKITGNVYYKAKDKYSIYMEHEVDDVVEVKVKRIPEPNFEFAYGSSLMNRKELLSNKRVNSILAPWVIAMLEKKLL